jgi:hypothetical protein
VRAGDCTRHGKHIAKPLSSHTAPGRTGRAFRGTRVGVDGIGGGGVEVSVRETDYEITKAFLD